MHRELRHGQHNMGMIRSSLKDLKNGLPPRALADRVHARGLIFVHVPKCAGTSVERAIRRHYRLSRISINPDTSYSAARDLLTSDADQHTALMRASEMRRDLLHYHIETGYKCITGHAPLGSRTLDICADSHDVVTLLRDPAERYRSHLRFNLTDRSRHGRISMPVEKFLDTPRAQAMGTLYTKYFSGLPMDADLTSTEAVERSIETLKRLSLVGLVEDLSGFAADLTCLTGHRITIGHENRTPARLPDAERAAAGQTGDVTGEQTGELIDAPVSEKIAELTSADRLVYTALTA